MCHCCWHSLRLGAAIGWLIAAAAAGFAADGGAVLNQFVARNLSGFHATGTIPDAKPTPPFWYPGMRLNLPAALNRQALRYEQRLRTQPDHPTATVICTITVWQYATAELAAAALQELQADDHYQAATAYHDKLNSENWQAFTQQLRNQAEAFYNDTSLQPEATTLPRRQETQQYAAEFSSMQLSRRSLDGPIKLLHVLRHPLSRKTLVQRYVGAKRPSATPGQPTPPEPTIKHRFYNRLTYTPVGAVEVQWKLQYFGQHHNCLIHLMLQRQCQPRSIPSAHNSRTNVITATPVPEPPFWTEVQQTFFALCGGKDLPFAPDVAPQITVTYAAAGFVPLTRLFTSADLAPFPSRIIGSITATDGTPIAGAQATLVMSPTTASSDSAGRYVLQTLSGGSQLCRLNYNAVLDKQVKGLQCHLTSRTPLVANGRLQPVTIVLTNNGKPLPNRKIRLTLPPSWQRNGREAIHVGVSPLFSEFPALHRTDANGCIALPEFPVPVTVASLGVLQEHEARLYFPVQGELLITDLATGVDCRATYSVISPYPALASLQMTSSDAQAWPDEPQSALVIDDPDSAKFSVSIKAAGQLQCPGDKGYYRNGFWKQLNGNRVAFNYKPPTWETDPLRIGANHWAQLAKLELRLHAAARLAASGKPQLTAVTISTLPANPTLPDQLESAGGANILQAIMAPPPKHATAQAPADSSPCMIVCQSAEHIAQLQEDLNPNPDKLDQLNLAGSDTVLGVVESTHLLDNQISAYANTKHMHSLHRYLQAVDATSQHSVVVPVIITIKDPDNYTLRAIRSVTVRVWQPEE